jgi:hypothetical protein
MATEVIRSDKTAPRYGSCSVQQSDKTWRLHAADVVEDIICYSRGAAVDVFNFGGAHCQTWRQHPPGAPSLTSSTSVVAAVGHAVSTPTGHAIDISYR